MGSAQLKALFFFFTVCPQEQIARIEEWFSECLKYSLWKELLVYFYKLNTIQLFILIYHLFIWQAWALGRTIFLYCFFFFFKWFKCPNVVKVWWMRDIFMWLECSGRTGGTGPAPCFCCWRKTAKSQTQKHIPLGLCCSHSVCYVQTILINNFFLFLFKYFFKDYVWFWILNPSYKLDSKVMRLGPTSYKEWSMIQVSCQSHLF